MTDISPTPNESIVDPLVELARCSKQHRIIVAGTKGPQLMFQLYRRGYRRVATTATCGLPDGRYDVALVDWQDHSVQALATTLDWLPALFWRPRLLRSFESVPARAGPAESLHPCCSNWVSGSRPEPVASTALSFRRGGGTRLQRRSRREHVVRM